MTEFKNQEKYLDSPLNGPDRLPKVILSPGLTHLTIGKNPSLSISQPLDTPLPTPLPTA